MSCTSVACKHPIVSLWHRDRPLNPEDHRRYLMVDVVVNDVMAPSLQPDYSKYMFKNPVRMFLVCVASGGGGINLFCVTGAIPPVLPDFLGKHYQRAGLLAW